MTDDAPTIPKSKPPVYVVAIVLIVGIGVAGVLVKPEQAVAILTFCGSILVALIALLKAQEEVHDAVNSKMDLLLAVVRRSSKAEGVEEGRAAQKAEQEKQEET